MHSFLGGLLSLLVGCLLGFPRRIIEEFDQSMDSCVEFFRNWLSDSRDSTQQTIASAQLSTNPAGGWLALVRSFLGPKRLARVRVPARRSIR